MAELSLRKPRSWTIEDLYNRKAHIRAVLILVLEKWEREGGTRDADRLTTEEIHDELLARGLLEKPMTKQGAGNLVGSFRQTQKRLNLKPTLVEPIDRGVWRFNVRSYESLLREFRERYPIIGESAQTPAQQELPVSLEKYPAMKLQSVTDSILEILREYERHWQERLWSLENQVEALERENENLREKVDKGGSILHEIVDDVLKKRLSRLGSPPLDTIIREAGVVLEDRLRAVGGVDSQLHGVDLVDAALAPGRGTLLFSTHPGEQDGVRMLYRGAMQFIRNPPMHRLIDYHESTAELFIRLIDSLLQLLSEATPKP